MSQFSGWAADVRAIKESAKPYTPPEPWYSSALQDVGNTIVDTGRAALRSVIGAINTVAPNALPTATAALAQLTYRGTTGNFQSAMEPIVLSAKFQHVSQMNPESFGSPCYMRDYINTFSGFVLCDHPHFSTGLATSVEESAIEAFMSGGFYVE